MRVFYKKCNGELRFVANAASQEEAIAASVKFMRQLYPDYEVPYIRGTAVGDAGIVAIDVGSHRESFILEVKEGAVDA